jgi:nucleoside-diphosphate-sugar epimerase
VGATRVVLITGGAGYVGSVLVNGLLADGYSVRVLDDLIHGSVPTLLYAWGDNPFEFVRGDVRDSSVRFEALRDVYAVVHLAAIVGDPACAREPDLAREVNLQATGALLEEANQQGVKRFIFASTCSNYGKLESNDAFATEDWDLRPVSLYAETKVAAEREVLSQNSRELACCCLRLATVYGVSPRMRFDLTVNEFARDASLGRELLVYGEQFWRPYIHVRDAAAAIRTVLDAPAADIGGQVFNIGNTNENYRKQDLVDLLRERLPSATIRFVPKDEDPRDYRVSFQKAEERLKFTTSRTVGDGMDEVIALVRSGLIDPDATSWRN